MNTEVIPYEERVGALTPADVRSQVNLIQHIMKDVMKKDEHYGVIPGTGTKPSLLKAGAEKLCLTFRLDPQYEITKEQDGLHLTVISKCTLFHIPSSQRYGSGMGSCSTRESKYAYRQAAIKCPACAKECVIKGKEQYGGGWICFGKKGGCGAKFKDGDQSIEGQPRGRVPNEDIADQYNTVLKMANKRSLVAAVLNATAASDIFTQDIEDMPQFTAKVVPDEDVTAHMDNRSPPAAAQSEAVTPPSSVASTPSAAGAFIACISPDQVIALEDALKESGRSKAKLLSNIGREYGFPIDRLAQIKAADYREALNYASKRS